MANDNSVIGLTIPHEPWLTDVIVACCATGHGRGDERDSAPGGARS